MIPKVSIIVPVYKTEKYLAICLDSLLEQSLQDIEIILVNDGSPDHCQEIINEYVKRFPDKILSVIKETEGPGPARNDGITIARGEYLGFVDSDDWVDRTMFEKLYNMALQGHDLVICDYVEVMTNKSRHVLRGFIGPRFNHSQAVMYSTDNSFTWNKLYKRRLFNKVAFSEGWYEDMATIPLLLTYAKSPAYVESPLYYYRKFRPGSITSSVDSKTLGVIKAWERLLTKANPRYHEEMVYAVARSIPNFIYFKPEYTPQFMEFAKRHQDLITANHYYKEAVKNKQLMNIFA